MTDIIAIGSGPFWPTYVTWQQPATIVIAITFHCDSRRKPAVHCFAPFHPGYYFTNAIRSIRTIKYCHVRFLHDRPKKGYNGCTIILLFSQLALNLAHLIIFYTDYISLPTYRFQVPLLHRRTDIPIQKPSKETPELISIYLVPLVLTLIQVT